MSKRVKKISGFGALVGLFGSVLYIVSTAVGVGIGAFKLASYFEFFVEVSIAFVVPAAIGAAASVSYALFEEQRAHIHFYIKRLKHELYKQRRVAFGALAASACFLIFGIARVALVDSREGSQSAPGYDLMSPRSIGGVPQAFEASPKPIQQVKLSAAQKPLRVADAGPLPTVYKDICDLDNNASRAEVEACEQFIKAHPSNKNIGGPGVPLRLPPKRPKNIPLDLGAFRH